MSRPATKRDLAAADRLSSGAIHLLRGMTPLTIVLFVITWSVFELWILALSLLVLRPVKARHIAGTAPAPV